MNANNQDQLVKPDSIDIRYGGFNDTIIYRWHSCPPKHIIRTTFIVCGIILSSSNSYYFLMYVLGILFLMSLLPFLAYSINNTYIAISSEQLSMKSSPISLKKKKTIDINNITDIVYEQIGSNYVMFVQLDNGKKENIVKSYQDKNCIMYLEKIIKEKIMRNKIKLKNNRA